MSITLTHNDQSIGFIHIPKTAGISIGLWFYQLRNTTLQHYRLHDRLEDIPPVDISIAVVRNPWERMVSMYSFVVAQCEKFGVRMLVSGVDVGSNYPDFKTFIRELPNITFDNEQLPPSQEKIVWFDLSSPQSFWIPTDPTILIRFETLEEDFVAVQNLFECITPLVKSNESVHGDFRDYYDAETIDLVATYFAQDIARWGYTFL